MRPTTEERRAHYDDFVTQVIALCQVNGVRADLVSGRGRPVEDCARMPEHLTRHIAGFGAQRAHFTVAGLIAMQRDLIGEDGPYLPESATTAGHSSTGSTQSDSAETQPAEDTTAANTQALENRTAPAGKDASTARTWRARPNLGTSLAIAVARHGLDHTRMTAQLKVLTRSSTQMLHPALWRLTARLHGRDAARLDFAVLLEDLAWWDYDRKTIAARWRDSYFTALHTLTPDED
ncbi:type I-E CRISPR-associated protein Cse2/CasB [Streptomyces sp. NPDC054783]